MRIDNISFFELPELKKVNSTSNNINFNEILKNELDKVNDNQINAEQATQDLLTGKATDIHQVLIATEEARLSLELAVQIRNKLVDAYQEISRMQI
ncbi:MAG: fliE [Clostridiales bacterium]|jgi:flagellar hook-basal body complex protein FliE|nr:fliE [Clostridiales bacterium]